jgi:hypothetical protein
MKTTATPIGTSAKRLYGVTCRFVQNCTLSRQRLEH